MRSTTVTGTFILSDYSHTIPVINITIDSDDLYDKYRGICVEGPGASAEFPHYGANYWKGMWKKAHIELYDSVNGGFSTGCEMAVFGGYSRALPKKSFKIRFKNNFDQPQITYDLFNNGNPETFKKFVLRSGSQDIYGTMVRDEFFTSLMAPQSPDLLIQAYRPVALYINGEYYGLYYIREMIDKDFVARHLNVSNDEVSIIQGGIYRDEGSIRNYRELMSYVSSHNLAEKENYDYVCERFDVVGLIDFKIGEIYSCNTDVGNMRFVRSEDNAGDRKWHVVFYDLDATWATVKPSAYYLRAGKTFMERHVNMLTSELMKNKDFRDLFLQRLSHHLHHTFTTAGATAVFDNLINTVKPEMRNNCERWPQLISYSHWEKHVGEFREKINNRNKTMLNDIRKELKVTDEENRKYFSDLGFD